MKGAEISRRRQTLPVLRLRNDRLDSWEINDIDSESDNKNNEPSPSKKFKGIRQKTNNIGRLPATKSTTIAVRRKSTRLTAMVQTKMICGSNQSNEAIEIVDTDANTAGRTEQTEPTEQTDSNDEGVESDDGHGRQKKTASDWNIRGSITQKILSHFFDHQRLQSIAKAYTARCRHCPGSHSPRKYYYGNVSNLKKHLKKVSGIEKYENLRFVVC